MQLVKLWERIWNKHEGRCFICQISEPEGSYNCVCSIFMERQVDPATFSELEFVVVCATCRQEIENSFGKQLANIGIMRKYWRIRGQIVKEIDARRKEEEVARRAQGNPRRA